MRQTVTAVYALLCDGLDAEGRAELDAALLGTPEQRKARTGGRAQQDLMQVMQLGGG